MVSRNKTKESQILKKYRVALQLYKFEDCEESTIGLSITIAKNVANFISTMVAHN